jgi:CubicO group peptidase (beta-lactamase class C family)
MRSFVQAAFAALVMATAGPAARAQQAEPPAPPAAAETPVAGPAAPIPYTALRPKPAAPKPAAPKAAAKPAPPAPAATPAPALPPPQPPGQRAERGARLAPGQAIPAADLESFVDGVVGAAMAREHIAGVTVAVVQNGQVLLKKGYGFASLAPRRPVDPDRTLFRLGSVSEAFTWTGLMKQAEAGRLRLDQPINLYLPERVQVRDQGYDRPVRALDLMAHAAGFEDRSYGRHIERNPRYIRPLDLYLRKERPRRVRPPGQVSSYSSYDAGLAGMAAAWVGGKTFERLMEDDVFVPLGMGRTTFREPRPAVAGLPAPMPETLAADAAEGFRWTPTGFARRPYEYLGQNAPYGAASSTAGDMARYMLALLGGGRLGEVTLYGPRTAQAFRTPILNAPRGVNGWAHGFKVMSLPGGRTGYGLDGETLAFAANMVTAPDLGLGIFVAANTEGARGLTAALPQAVIGEFFAPARPFPRDGSPELAQAPDGFEGRYLSTRRAYSGLQGFVDALRRGAEASVTPDGRLVIRTRTGAEAWVPDGPLSEGRFVALQGDERLAFRTADGAAPSFQTGDGAQVFERAPFWRTARTLGLAASLAAAAAVATLAGVLGRDRRETRENPVQSRAALIQNIQAGLWLTAMVLFGVWLARSQDPAALAYGWPGVYLVIASACALVAAALTAATLVALPAVWRGGRRVDSWAPLRKLSFTVTAAIYTAFSVLLTLWGALAPWSA